MTGTVPVAGDLTMGDLAATITKHEQLTFTRMTGLAVNPAKVGNLVTYVDDDDQLGELAVVSRGGASMGTLIISSDAYIQGKQTAVDVYRLL